MKKFTSLLLLLLTMFLWGGVNAYAVDFTPAAGEKYLIRCKKLVDGAHNYAIFNTTCTRGNNSNNTTVKKDEDKDVIILSCWKQTDERSFFTFENVSGNEFYIRSAKDPSQYVYAFNNKNEDSNVGIKSFIQPDETCQWTITYNTKTRGFNIKPKGGSNGWNCRGSYSGNNHIGQWESNDTDDNTWFFISEEATKLNGYYTLKNNAADSRGKFYFNDFTYPQNTNNYTLGNTSMPENLTNNYVWHVVYDNGELKVNNGQGGAYAFISDDNNQGGKIQTSSLAIAACTNVGYCFDPVMNAGDNGYRKLGDYNYLTQWAGGGANHGDNLWNFNKVDDASLTAYTVECNRQDGYVTLSATGEVAKNNGFFLSSTAISSDDLEATSVGVYKGTVTVNDQTHTITVTYTMDADLVKTFAANVETEVLSKRGVGYPLTSSEAYSGLQTAINKAQNATADDVQALYEALVAAEKVYKTTSDVQFPEDGHTYVITNMHMTQEKKYLNYAESGLTYESRGTGSAESLPQSAKFTCHKVNDKYVFANNDGKYLVWKGKDSGANENKGYTDGYDETYCQLTLKKMGTKGYVNASAETFFGYLSIFGKGYGDLSVFLNSFANDDKGNLYYQNSYSSAMQFEEVAYDNKVTPNPTDGKITGADYIATFSAPFATVIPQGVKAWYVERNDTKAEMHAVEGDAIPANTGVILTATSADAFYMVPAAGEVTATIQSNELGNSAGQAIELAEGQGYILGKGTQGVAFYKAAAGTLPRNRAYLKSNGSSANTISMVFGDATGISDILTPADAVNAPIYDLSGRRVNKALKGGLYIQNGRKVIVK